MPVSGLFFSALMCLDLSHNPQNEASASGNKIPSTQARPNANAVCIMFEGTHTALITPFREGVVDEAAFEALIAVQIQEGVNGIVPVGTTGESPTLDHVEHLRVIELAVKAASGKCKVIAGTGSNCTAEAVNLTREAEQLGADAALLVAPYYNRPTQEGLFQHYSAIACSTKLPIMLYSIPGRCGVAIEVPTVARLAASWPNIVAIKEAGGDVDRVSQLRQALPEAFEILCGDDGLTLPFLSAGAIGVVSVASNIIPREVGNLVKSWRNGNPDDALKLHEKWLPFFKALFIEANPVPVKAALAMQGRCSPDVRLPLCNLTAEHEAFLRNQMEQLSLL